MEFSQLIDRLDKSTGPLRAVSIALKYGSTEEAHHKAWVIDQMLREILDRHYELYIEIFKQGGEYEWDTGIAP